MPYEIPGGSPAQARKGGTALEILKKCSRWRYGGINNVVGGELFAIKLANEVLSTRPARDGTGVQVHHQHPLVFTWLWDWFRLVDGGAVHRQLEQVRALPDATYCVGRAKVAELGPILEIRRGVEPDHML